jgi:hypothetical protein
LYRETVSVYCVSSETHVYIARAKRVVLLALNVAVHVVKDKGKVLPITGHEGPEGE